MFRRFMILGMAAHRAKLNPGNHIWSARPPETALSCLSTWTVSRISPLCSALAWLMVALMLLLVHWPQTARNAARHRRRDAACRDARVAQRFGPAERLVRLHHSRLQPPGGVDMHWSRLIDAGLAGLFTFFHLFADQADAERLMRAWWPLLWLLPDHGGHDRNCVADRRPRSGDGGAAVFHDLAIPAYQQFTPGRIDHHNVQIALTLARRSLQRHGRIANGGAAMRPVR